MRRPGELAGLFFSSRVTALHLIARVVDVFRLPKNRDQTLCSPDVRGEVVAYFGSEAGQSLSGRSRWIGAALRSLGWKPMLRVECTCRKNGHGRTYQNRVDGPYVQSLDRMPEGVAGLRSLLCGSDDGQSLWTRAMGTAWQTLAHLGGKLAATAEVGAASQWAPTACVLRFASRHF
jgi:hypothetical protein